MVVHRYPYNGMVVRARTVDGMDRVRTGRIVGDGRHTVADSMEIVADQQADIHRMPDVVASQDVAVSFPGDRPCAVAYDGAAVVVVDLVVVGVAAVTGQAVVDLEQQLVGVVGHQLMLAAVEDHYHRFVTVTVVDPVTQITVAAVQFVSVLVVVVLVVVVLVVAILVVAVLVVANDWVAQ